MGTRHDSRTNREPVLREEVVDHQAEDNRSYYDGENIQTQCTLTEDLADHQHTGTVDCRTSHQQDKGSTWSESFRHQRYCDRNRSRSTDIHRDSHTQDDQHVQEFVVVQGSQPLVRYCHRNQGSDEQTDDQPLTYILQHLYKTITQRTDEFLYKRMMMLMVMLFTTAVIMIVTVAMVMIITATVTMVVLTRLAGLSRQLFIFFRISVDQPTTEHGRKQCGYRTDDSEGQAHQRISSSDTVNTRLRRGDQKTGAGTMTGTLFSE